MMDVGGVSPVSTSSNAHSASSASTPKLMDGVSTLLEDTNRLMSDSAEDFAQKTGAVNDALTQRPSLDRPSDLNAVIVSRSEFSAAQNLGETDMNTGIDSIGGPMELVDRAVEQMAELGQNAVLAQANQLPPVAMALGE